MSDSSSPHDAGDDLSGLMGFFFYAFIIHPVVAWILRPGRFERRKSIMYAIAFLAGIAAVKTGLELKDRGRNYYAMLDVTRASSPLDIKRAYKRLSLDLHPDKNRAPDATEQFNAVKQAYDVLMDLELREVYNKFGREGIKSNKRYDETQFLLETAIYYVSYGMIAFLLTMGKKNGEARNWTLTGLMAMLVIEVALMTSQSNPLPAWLFPTVTEHEVVWLLHSLFPAFMNGCRSLGAYLFVDLEAQTRMLLLALQEQNKDILLVLREVQIGVNTIQVHGVSGGGAAAGNNARLVTDGVTGGPVRATPTGKLKELQERLHHNSTTVAQAVQQLRSDGGKSNSNTGFYMMIIGYVLISYWFNS